MSLRILYYFFGELFYEDLPKISVFPKTEHSKVLPTNVSDLFLNFSDEPKTSDYLTTIFDTR